ncbi:MAG: PilZ domain-containing protein, partial [Desulfomonilia bacterium]|nr:PilZ domain-containing protein [Desulfomonilia bacterium]
RRRIHTPAIYDIGSGPEQGKILNMSEDGVLLETNEKISADHEIRLTVSGKNAKGKAIWSIADPSGEVETGVKLTQISEEFIDEIKKLID